MKIMIRIDTKYGLFFLQTFIKLYQGLFKFVTHMAKVEEITQINIYGK